MTKQVLWALALMITVCWPSLALAQSDGPLTIERAYALAANNSPQIEAQRQSVLAAQAQLSEAKHYWAPKFSLKSYFGPMPKVSDPTASENDIWSNFTRAWGFTTRNSLEMWMPLFTSTKIHHTTKLANIGLEVETLRAENERFNVAYDVARAYYGLQFAIAAGDVIVEAEDYIQRVEKEYIKLLEAENPSVKRTDQYRIDIAKSKLYSLKNQVNGARIYAEQALAVHTRLELPIAIETMDFDDKQPSLKSYDSLLAFAQMHRADLKLVQSAEAAAHLMAKIEWLNWWPDLLLVGEATYKYSNAVPKYASNDFYVKDGYNGYGFGLAFMLRWELDPARQVFKVKGTDAKANQTLAQMSLARSGIELELSQVYQETLNAHKGIEIAYNARRSAKRLLTQELLNYEAGDGDVDELISALVTFIEQRTLYLQALHDFRVASVKLQKSLGAQEIGAVFE